MPQVQIFKHREMDNATGRAILAELNSHLKIGENAQQGGVGRLHLEGKTIGENPFAPWLRQQLAARGYRLDSINWAYWRQFPDEDSAEREMAALGVIRAEMSSAADAAMREEVANMHFRVMIDPIIPESWDEVENY